VLDAAHTPATFVFVLGTGRCGSTLVHELLARHPDVGFVSNLDDRLSFLGLKGRWNPAMYRRVPPALTRKGRVRFGPSEGYSILASRVSPLIATSFRDLTADDATPWLAVRFRRFFEDRARAQGKRVFVHKFTGWPRARFVHEVLPEARFVNVVRDGRAVANSLLQMPWWRGYRGISEWGFGELPEGYAREWEASGRSFVLLAGLQWKVLMDAFEEAKEAIPAGRWLDVRYEDFVGDPGGYTEELLRFVGLSWTAAFRRTFRRHRFDTARTDAYRRELSPADVDALTASLGAHLGRYGYRTAECAAEGRATA
jgi:hypothetical protein